MNTELQTIIVPISMIIFVIIHFILFAKFYKSIKYKADILDYNIWTFLIKFKLNKQALILILFTFFTFILVLIEMFCF